MPAGGSKSGVERVRISTLPSLATVGAKFLAECSNLQHVSLEDLPALTELKAFALWHCPKLWFLLAKLA